MSRERIVRFLRNGAGGRIEKVLSISDLGKLAVGKVQEWTTDQFLSGNNFSVITQSKYEITETFHC